MGQYYACVITEEGKVPVPINTKDFGGLKLMEHSWWENEGVGKIAEMLHRFPLRVAWVGDYADQVGCDPLLRGAERAERSGIKLPYKPLFLDGKFLVNRTKGEYLDCDAYKKRAFQDDGWCVHPLPLLTAIGNGQGGGDYNPEGSDAEYVGRWTNDVIAVEDSQPSLCKEIICTFIEQ